MKEGFFGISNARYANPVTGGITQLQYNLNMKSLKGIEMDDSLRLTDMKSKEDEVEDPIVWFGYLPSKGLKDAQKSFEEALIEVVELANKMIKLRKCLDEWEGKKEDNKVGAF